MRDFAISIQRAVLTHLDLPRELWHGATGHSLTPQGTHTSPSTTSGRKWPHAA